MIHSRKGSVGVKFWLSHAVCLLYSLAKIGNWQSMEDTHTTIHNLTSLKGLSPSYVPPSRMSRISVLVPSALGRLIHELTPVA